MLSCRLVDTTNWVSIPPPEFTLSTKLTSVALRPGEQTDVNLVINGKAHLASEALLSIHLGKSDTKNSLSVDFSPNKTSIPAFGSGISNLHLAVSNKTEPKTDILSIDANISFPTIIDTHKAGLILNNSKIESLGQTSNLTLTVLHPYTVNERFNNFVDSWIKPIAALWTFAAGVCTVVIPLAIFTYRKRHKKWEFD